LLMGSKSPNNITAQLEVEWNKPIDKRKTIVTLLYSGINNILVNKTDAVELDDFLIEPNKDRYPNLKLLMGDQDLQNIDGALHNLSNTQSLLWGSSRRFAESMLILKKSIDSYKNKTNKKLAVFIDTNPAFTRYTAVAICSSDRILVPVKPDDFSNIAVKKLFDLVHGEPKINNTFVSDLGKAKFDLSSPKIVLPKVHLIISNQASIYDQRPAKAFEAMDRAVEETLINTYKEMGSLFTSENLGEKNIAETHMTSFRDLHSTGIISLHLGIDICSISGKYNIFGVPITANPGHVKDAKESLDEIISKL